MRAWILWISNLKEILKKEYIYNIYKDQFKNEERIELINFQHESILNNFG